MIREEAINEGLDIYLAIALVAKESLFRNVFGWDWGEEYSDQVPFAHMPVTPNRVRQLLKAIEENDYSYTNGVGLTQLTYPPLLFRAQSLGPNGAAVPRLQCRVGFQTLQRNITQYGYLRGLSAYNSGQPIVNDYGRDLAALHKEYEEKLRT